MLQFMVIGFVVGVGVRHLLELTWSTGTTTYVRDWDSVARRQALIALARQERDQ